MLTTEIIREKALASPHFDLPISDAQLVVLNIKMKECLGMFPWYAQREMKLRVLSYIFDKQVVSTKFMTMGEAQAILDAATYQSEEFYSIIKEALRKVF